MELEGNEIMHERRKSSILNQLSRIVDSAPASFSKDYSVNWRSFARDELEFCLVGENFDSYNNLLKELLIKDKWGAKFSEKYVDKVLQDAIFNIIEHGINKATQDFTQICNEVESYSIEQKVYIPLGGISLHGVEDFILGRIQFKKLTCSNLSEILEATQAIIRTTKYSPEEQELFIEENNKTLEKEFSGQVCAIYRVVAEPNRARELAEQETELSLDLLRYSIPALYSDGAKYRTKACR
ncbi:MAG TPA: hypothetical protein V6D10_15765 [Trichocoleus sp.]